MSRSSTARVKKDILLELVSRDIKELQRAQSDTESSIDAFTNSEEQSQLLCDHMDHVLMHGLREFEDGYWPFVCYFTRNELVQKITRLKRVTTSLGKGRSWLYTALNEQSVESYVRMFAENQDIVEEFYLRDAFLRDIERLLLLLTLVSGLDFISFNLDMDCDYLDYGPSRLSSQIGSQGSIEVEPSFLSEKVGEVIRSRTSSDPTKRVATVISSVKQTKDVSSRRRDLSASCAGTTATTKTHKHSTVHNESENVLHGDIVPDNSIHSNRVSIPSSIGSDESRSTNPVMSSSLQMTSSRNFLERVGSLESNQSPFLGHAALGSGMSRDRMKKDRSKKDRDEEEEDVLVAKERKSGRSKRRRKKRNGENETSEATNSNKSSPTNIQYEGHARKHESRMTKSDVSGITDSVSVTQLDTGENDTDSIPTRDHGNMGMEECDFETEPRHSIAGRRVSSEVIGTRREGEEEEGGMNLEMELALAAKDIQEDVLDSVQMDLKVGVVYGGSDNKSVFKKLANSDNIETFDKISEGVHQLEQPKVPRRDTKLPKSSGSLNPFEEEEPSPLSPLSPPTTHTSTRTRHTAPSDTGHHSHRVQSSHSEHPKSKLKVTREFGKPSRQRQTNRLDFDEDFDIITHKDMRELEGKRERANAVFTEGDREGGRGGRTSVPPYYLDRFTVYDGLPRRPQHITEHDRRKNDIKIDETMKVVFSIDVYLSESGQSSQLTSQIAEVEKDRQPQCEEDAKRLVHVNTPAGLGQYRAGYVLVTSEAVYMLRRDGIEGIFCREFGVRYRDIDHLVIGLGWQSLEMVYRDSGAELQNCIFLTGSEAVSKSLMDSIQEAATECNGFKKVIPKNKDDENRIEAIEGELIKLGSETNMDIVQYSLVNWEQVEGESPKSIQEQPNKEIKCGYLRYKSTTRLGLSSWKQGFFRLTVGALYQYNNESDKILRVTHSLSGCGGCKRLTGENTFVISVALDNTQPLLLSTTTEDDLIQWQQALCEVTLDRDKPSSDQRRNAMCTVLLTHEKVHILQEDLLSGNVSHIMCCEVTAIESVCVDHTLPLYCTVSYDDGEDCKGVWLLCFSSEYELGKFEAALANLWKEQFQIDLPFTEITEGTISQRAHHAIELMQTACHRSDSVTKGRTEFTYSSM